MKTSKRYTIDMCNGPLAGKILRFALPLMAANILQLTFNAADVMVVGKFVGDTSQAAVTSTSSLINLLINLFVGLSVGVNVVVARALGRGEKSGIRKVAHTAITLGLVAGVFLILVGELLAPVMLRLMGSPEHTSACPCSICVSTLSVFQGRWCTTLAARCCVNRGIPSDPCTI